MIHLLLNVLSHILRYVMEFASNKCVHSLTKQPALSNNIRKHRLQWFGHLQRMDNNRIPKRLYQWTPTHGKLRSGRRRTTWKNVIQRDLRRLGIEWSTGEAEVAAQDRSVWKSGRIA